MNIEGIDVFVKVVQTGSFTKAAASLGMPVTTVSGKVASLEKRLGVTLLHRTTRKIAVTEVGEVYFRHCVTALQEMETAEITLSARKGAPAGTLRITTTADVGHILLWPLVKGYLKTFPSMKVELVLTNRYLDLVQENIDLAVRIGDLKDSSMIARSFVQSPGHLWASPSYLKKSAPIKHPRDLEKHNCINFSKYISQVIELEKGDEKIQAPFPGRINVDDMQTVKSFVLSGEGIGTIPQFLCDEEYKNGKLMKVLPSWTWIPTKLSFVYPAQRFVSPKVQSFIEHALQNYLPSAAKA